MGNRLSGRRLHERIELLICEYVVDTKAKKWSDRDFADWFNNSQFNIFLNPLKRRGLYRILPIIHRMGYTDGHKIGDITRYAEKMHEIYRKLYEERGKKYLN